MSADRNQLPKQVIQILFLVSAISNMSMDIHLPAIPMIVEDLDTSYFAAQSLFIIYYTVGTVARIVLGPLIDTFGRRKTLLRSLDLQILGLFLQSFAPRIEMLLVGRVIQSLASGAIIILAATLISDVYQGRKRAEMLSINEYIQPLALILGPLIGGEFARYTGWRGGFIFVLICLTLGRILLSKHIVETSNASTTYSKKEEFSYAFGSYPKLMLNQHFMYNNLIMAFVVAAYMMYALVSSYIYEEHFGFGPRQFAIYQSIPLLVQALVGFAYKKLPLKLDQIINAGIAILIGVICMSLGFVFELIPFIANTLLLFVSLLCSAIGLIFPACMKNALEIFPSNKGTSSSAISVTRGMVIGVTMTFAGTLIYNLNYLFLLIILSLLTSIYFRFILYKLNSNQED